MKQTHDIYSNELEPDQLIEMISAKQKLDEKTRINLYLPKVIVRLIDYLAKNRSRGELVSSLIVDEIKKRKKLPFGMFSGVEISEQEINKITSGLHKTINELT